MISKILIWRYNKTCTKNHKLIVIIACELCDSKIKSLLILLHIQYLNVYTHTHTDMHMHAHTSHAHIIYEVQ